MLDANTGNAAYVVQLILSGVVAGSLYAFAALAFVLAFRASSHVNLAATEMAGLGAFVTLLFTALGLPVWVAILAGLAVSFALGAGVERFLIRPAARHGEFAVILTTVALILIIGSLIGLVWGTDVLVSPAPFGAGEWVLMAGPPRATVSAAQLGVVGALVVVVGVLAIVMRHTGLGLGFRAIMANRDSALLVGVPVRRLYAIGWGMAAVVGTLGALLLAATVGTMDYAMMVPMLIYGIAAATLGGFDSIAGAVVGGLVVGLLVNTVPGLVSFIPGQLGFVVALLVILVVLLVRPQGLFGRARLERV